MRLRNINRYTVDIHRYRAVLMVAVVLLDQTSKFLASKLGFEIVSNQGIAFGLLPGFAWLAILPLALLSIFLARKLLSKYLILNTKYLILILGGGISNLIDRLLFGAVRDWISLPMVPTFNLADFSISLGFLVFVYKLLA